MAGEYKPIDDRELARRVVTRGNSHKPIAGTRGGLQKLNPGELEYLGWLGRKVLVEQASQR